MSRRTLFLTIAFVLATLVPATSFARLTDTCSGLQSAAKVVPEASMTLGSPVALECSSSANSLKLSRQVGVPAKTSTKGFLVVSKRGKSPVNSAIFVKARDETTALETLKTSKGFDVKKVTLVGILMDFSSIDNAPELTQAGVYVVSSIKCGGSVFGKVKLSGAIKPKTLTLRL